MNVKNFIDLLQFYQASGTFPSCCMLQPKISDFFITKHLNLFKPYELLDGFVRITKKATFCVRYQQLFVTVYSEVTSSLLVNVQTIAFQMVRAVIGIELIISQMQKTMQE